MSAQKPPRKGDSTLIVPASPGAHSATQILRAAELKGKKPGDSSILHGERIRRTGLSVSAKFALIVSAAIALFMLVFGMALYSQQKGALNEQIDAAGIHAARALAAADISAWYQFNGAYENTDFGGYETAIAKGDKKIPEGALKKEQIEEAKKRTEFNRQRLAKLISEDDRVLDVMITDPSQREIIRIASASPKLAFSPQSGREDLRVQIGYGTYVASAGEIPARSFTASIVGFHGSEVGKATVVLSERSIQESLQGVQKRILLLTLFFVALGVGVSFMMGARVTAPITDLTHDVEVIAKGDLDHKVKVGAMDEIGVLAKTVARMTQSLKGAQEAEVEHAKQKHQLAVALEIQSNLFPKTLPQVPGYDLAAFYRPGPEVGGDYYDVFPMQDGRLFLAVASASGKGIPAAMLTVMARSFTTATAERENDIASIFKIVNRLLSPDLRRGMYVTSLAAILDPKSGRLQVANAGHHPLIRYDAATKAVAPVHADGIGLGFDKGPVFDRTLRVIEVELKPGDRVTMVTPGVFGIKNREGHELGEENFHRLVAREAAKESSAFVKLVTYTLDQFLGGSVPDSDITFLTLRRS